MMILDLDCTELASETAQAAPTAEPAKAQRQNSLQMIPGIPPQIPLDRGLPMPPARRPQRPDKSSAPSDRRLERFSVTLRRGFYPGFSWGEMLIIEDHGSFKLVEAWLPNFQGHADGHSFKPCEHHEVIVNTKEPLYNYHVAEIVSDRVTGPVYRIRNLPGTVWQGWRKLHQDSLPLYVQDEFQPSITMVTGVMFKLVRQLQAERQRAFEDLERQRRQQERRFQQARSGRGRNQSR